MSTEHVPLASAIGAPERLTAVSLVAHPLAPLTSSEITKTADLIQALYPAKTKLHFKVVTLEEPSKDQLIPYLDAEHNGQKPPSLDRKAFVCYYIRNTVGMAEEMLASSLTTLTLLARINSMKPV